MLQASHLAYQPHPLVGNLFHGVSLSIAPGDKVALVGRNGVGKTKLMEILAGRLKPDSGAVSMSKGWAVGYLPQDFDHSFDGSLEEFFVGQAESRGLSREELELGLRKLGHQFGIGPAMLEQSFQSLSLGERMRATVLLLLLEAPDVLLLDEPTNHLDLEAKLWLEGFLERCRQGVLMVCHDRATMDRVAKRVLELTPSGLVEYTGNFSRMQALKAQDNERRMEAWEKQKQEDRRLCIAAERAYQHAADMTKRPTSRTYDPKQKAFYSGKQAKLDKRARAIKSRVEHVRAHAVEKPFVGDSVKVYFHAVPLRSEIVLAARGLTKSYGDRTLFEDLNLTLFRESRLCVAGPNGSGKSTLFRILLGEENLDRGDVEWSPDARIAFLSQSRIQFDLDPPLLEALDVHTPDREQQARTLLGALGMRGDIAFKRVGDLSVGERSKLELVKIVLSPANVLVLDEPTNHLDLESLEALEEALKDFPGPILFTSHDRFFVERTADQVVDLAR